MMPRTRRLVWMLAGWLTASTAAADWLVTRDGERIETRGAWEARGRRVVFTSTSGTLSSIRLSEIDLEASREATARALLAEAPAQETPPPPAPPPPALVITTEDVGEGTPGAQGPDLLVERLRMAHRFGDAGLAMSLVNWEDVPESMRPDIESQFAWMMERRVRDVRFVPAEADAEGPQQVQDGVAYELNLEPAGTIEVDFVPDPDQDELRLTFHVGSRLGVYFIAAPREAGPGQAGPRQAAPREATE